MPPLAEDRGFTLVEVMIVAVIVAIIAALAVPNFRRVLDRAALTRTVLDMRTLQQDIGDFRLRHERLPVSLEEAGRGGMMDAWGNPYQYTVIEGVKGKGKFRKDRFLVPLNSDYDLFSMGPDGDSQGPLSAKASRDDIIRANDGGYVGLASEF